ncbi:alpha/beta hydrolase [Streptococcus intermedius]
MMKKIALIMGILTILLSISVFLFYRTKAEGKLDKNNNYVQSTTPTLFFHGYGSSANAERHMTDAAKKAGVTKTVIRANVDRNGQVTLKGNISKGAVNPIVEVNYEDNLNPIDVGRYAKAVVSKLQEKYGFTKMNMVGHSLGNMSILYYLLDHGQDEKLPQLQKQVNIANFAAGLEAMGLSSDVKVNEATGQPNQVTQIFQRLLPLREVFPQNQVDVLNIYGDYKNGSDGSVLNASSRSLKYLVSDNAKSYQEKKITGKLAQHSQLHENPEVDKLLIQFLWGK